MLEVICHFKERRINIIKLMINDEVYTIKKQAMVEGPVSMNFNLFTEDKIIKLKFSKIFEWSLVSINDIEKPKKRAVKSGS